MKIIKEVHKEFFPKKIKCPYCRSIFMIEQKNDLDYSPYDARYHCSCPVCDEYFKLPLKIHNEYRRYMFRLER